jgi:ubiquinone/menaquinone biosynthesis C-methylase UbiE
MRPPVAERRGRRPVLSGEDLIEISGIDVLHPGGLDLSRRIGALVHFDAATRVLDVSSGKGRFACLYAQEYGCTVTGLEIQEEFVAAARRHAHTLGVSGRVEFRTGDSRQMPFPDGAFDVVVNECAVGLTAIGAPQRVLDEMVRVTRPGGKIVIHENTWLKPLSADERVWAAQHIGTVPYTVAEWQQMLRSAGAVTDSVEDWSGLENLWKMRPGYKWNAAHPTDFLGSREKAALLFRLVRRHGPGAALGLIELNRFAERAEAYLRDGVLGYTLLVASKPAAGAGA